MISALCVMGSVVVVVIGREFVTIIEWVTNCDLVVVIGTETDIVTMRERVIVLVAKQFLP